jgi:hypothetical protein
LPFRPRKASSGGVGSGLQRQNDPPVNDLSKFESSENEEPYRHRMMVNLAALAVTVALAITGMWLAIEIADMRKKQDCVLSGRRNCMPIDVPRRAD